MSDTEPAAPEPQQRVLVWDAPTRIAHWSLVLLIAFAWWSAEVAHRLDWHRWSGYWVIGVLVFRLAWGVFGAETARFAQFVRGPGAIADYLRGKSPPRLSHNPIGALSVVAMLALILAQACLGLFAVDIDGVESGPLSDRVSFDLGRTLAEWHDRAFNLLLALIALHLAAIAWYAFRRQNLIAPMLTGRRPWPGDGTRPAPWWRFAAAVVAAAAVAWFISKGLRLRF